MVTAPHVHAFNATPIRHVGRCACGTFGKFYAATGQWTIVTHPASAKGLETRILRAREQGAASLPVTDRPRTDRAYDGERRFEREGERRRDLVSLFGPVERGERRRR